MYSRRQNLEIIGIPESQNKDVGSITLKVLKHIDVKAKEVEESQRILSQIWNMILLIDLLDFIYG